jgi:hypothetical protein
MLDLATQKLEAQGKSTQHKVGSKVVFLWVLIEISLP